MARQYPLGRPIVAPRRIRKRQRRAQPLLRHAFHPWLARIALAGTTRATRQKAMLDCVHVVFHDGNSHRVIPESNPRPSTRARLFFRRLVLCFFHLDRARRNRAVSTDMQSVEKNRQKKENPCRAHRCRNIARRRHPHSAPNGRTDMGRPRSPRQNRMPRLCDEHFVERRPKLHSFHQRRQQLVPRMVHPRHRRIPHRRAHAQYRLFEFRLVYHAGSLSLFRSASHSHDSRPRHLCLQATALRFHKKERRRISRRSSFERFLRSQIDCREKACVQPSRHGNRH